MRTTLDLNDALLRAARRKAAEQGTSLREVVETALRQHLGKGPASRRYTLQWRAETGRVQEGVDLTDRKALFDLINGHR